MGNKLLAVGTLVGLLSLGAPMSNAAAAVAPEPDASVSQVEVAPGADGETVLSGDSIQLVVSSDQSSARSAEAASPLSRDMGCTLAVHWPHGSTHVKGTINVKAEATCDVASPHLRLATSLIRVRPKTRQWTQGTVNV